MSKVCWNMPREQWGSWSLRQPRAWLGWLAGWLDTFRLVGFWFVICVAAGFPPFIPWGRWVGIR